MLPRARFFGGRGRFGADSYLVGFLGGHSGQIGVNKLAVQRLAIGEMWVIGRGPDVLYFSSLFWGTDSVSADTTCWQGIQSHRHKHNRP